MKTGPSLTAKVLIGLGLLVAIVAVAMLKEGPSRGSTGSPSTPNQATGVPRMVELGSVSCIPCKMMKPVMEELEKEYGPNLQIDFIDVWQNPDEGKRYGIESIPTQILYDADGRELTRHVGFWPKEEIVDAFKSSGVELKPR